MDEKSIENVKKQYEDEVNRLRNLLQQTQDYYKKQYDALEQQKQELLAEFNEKSKTLSICIERLRGAYTALVDFQEGREPTMVTEGIMKDFKYESMENQENVEKVEQEEIKQDNAEVEPEKGIENKEDINLDEIKKKSSKLVKEAKERGLVTPYEEFAKSELGKETAVRDITEAVSKERLAELHQSGEATLTEDEIKALEKLTQDVKESDDNTISSKAVDPKDVPDYLKEQYGIDENK